MKEWMDLNAFREMVLLSGRQVMFDGKL